MAEGKKVLVLAASLQDGRRRGKCGPVSVSHLDDLYGVVLFVFFFFFLSKIEILPFGLWFPCPVHDLATQIGHQGCSEENFMAHLKYQCIYPPFIQLLRAAFTGVVKWRKRVGVLGQAAQIWRNFLCQVLCHAAKGLALYGFALAGPGPGRAQSAALADLLGSGEKSLPSSASMDLSLCTFATYRSSEQPTEPTADFLNHYNNVLSPKQSIKIITTGTNLYFI